MKFADAYKQKQPITFEIFPPKGELSVDTLRNTLDELKMLTPDLISVTYSAGGTGNSNKTVDLAGIIKNEYGIEASAHLTCINSNLEKINEVIEQIRSKNIQNILALRGDRIEGSQAVDFKYASDLIYYLRDKGFCIGAACYPEGHMECESPEVDLVHLREKQEAGAEFLVSQLFFSNDSFYRFRDAADRHGITIPMSPGIMPILSKAQVSRMIFMCGASLPSAIIRILNKYEDKPEELRAASIEYAAGQISELLRNGADGVHIYTMNQPVIAKSILEMIDYKR